MSDVASAFKILIQAEPDQAMAAFKNIVDSTKAADKAADDWKMTLVALNSAWELFGKAWDFLGDIKDGFVSAAKSAGEFLAQGGEFNEQLGQFKSVAAAYGQSGEAVLTVIQKITGNTTSLEESMKIASKAIASGLSGPAMETALTYAKKWSEATGQEFGSLADTMVNALVKGRTGVIKEMGIIVEKGDDTAKIIDKMSAALGKFSESANVGDSFTSINNSLIEFEKRAGAAAQAAPTLVTWFTDLASSAFLFVKNFDYNLITEFFEVGAQSLRAFYDAFSGNFKSLWEYLSSFFSGNTTTIKDFFTTLSDVFFSFVEGAVSGWNSVIEAMQLFYRGAEVVFRGIGELVGWVVDQIIAIPDVFVTALEALAIGSKKFVDEFPEIANLIGFEKMTADANDFIVGLRAGMDETRAVVKETTKGTFDALAESMKNANEGLGGWKVGVEGIETAHIAVNDAINNIKYTPVKNEANAAFKEMPKVAAEEAKKAANETRAAFKDIGKDLYKGFGDGIKESLKGAFDTVSSLSKTLLDEIAENPFSNRAQEAQQQLDRELAMRERLVKILEELADPDKTKRELKVNVKVDGTNGAIRELVKKVMDEVAIKIDTEDVLMQGI